MAVRNKLIRSAMRGWISLNEHLMELTAEEILHAMEIENRSEVPRTTMLKRLGQRYHAIQVQALRQAVRETIDATQQD